MRGVRGVREVRGGERGENVNRILGERFPL